jgi:hypothetical protein
MKTWNKLPATELTGKKLTDHFMREFADNPTQLQQMVTSMLTMSRDVTESTSGANFRDARWPVDAKLMGPTRIPIREIEKSASEAYTALTGELLNLPKHLKP